MMDSARGNGRPELSKLRQSKPHLPESIASVRAPGSRSSLYTAVRMSREFPDRPMIGVGAVIIQDERALLVQRGQAPLLGEWSLPGGLLECGETLREATLREVREETG